MWLWVEFHTRQYWYFWKMYLHTYIYIKIQNETHNHVELTYANKKILLKSQALLNNIIKLWVGGAGELIQWLASTLLLQGVQWLTTACNSILHLRHLYCPACHPPPATHTYIMKNKTLKTMIRLTKLAVGNWSRGMEQWISAGSFEGQLSSGETQTQQNKTWPRS